MNRYIRKIGKAVFVSFMVIVLTILTQIGGLVFLLSIYFSAKWKLTMLKFSGLFSIFYLFITFAITPFIAPFFGRIPLPLFGNLRPLNFATCLLNRHYVRPALKAQLISVAEEMSGSFSGTKTNYLDANFPFFNGFPLFPHLSHNDGRKIDLAFYYKDVSNDESSNSAPSSIGYGVYEEPVSKEINYPKECADRGYWQYGLLGEMVLERNNNLTLDVKRTRELIRLLANDELTSKIFIEPHLKQRWHLEDYDNIRFHGCQAVRHDDHIHVQSKY